MSRTPLAFSVFLGSAALAGAPKPSWRAHFERQGVTDKRVLAAANAVNRADFLDELYIMKRVSNPWHPNVSGVGGA